MKSDRQVDQSSEKTHYPLPVLWCCSLTVVRTASQRQKAAHGYTCRWSQPMHRHGGSLSGKGLGVLSKNAPP